MVRRLFHASWRHLLVCINLINIHRDTEWE
jgi:hypothetical protein